MWKLDNKKGWALKNWCLQTVGLEKTLESPLVCKEIKPASPKGNQPWIFIGRTDSKAEAPILLATCWEELTHWKRPWCWQRLKAGGEGDGRGWDGCMASLTRWTWVWASSGSWWWTGKPLCCSPWGCKELATTEWPTSCSVAKLCSILHYPWTAAPQASLSRSISQSLPKFMSIELVMPSNHLTVCHPLLLLPSIFPASGSFPASQLFPSVAKVLQLQH